MAPLPFLASLEAASTREELLRACQRFCASACMRSGLLCSPPFFDFVAKAVRATDPSDPELADAVGELIKDAAAALRDAFQNKGLAGERLLEVRDAMLERSIFGAIGAVVDAAKRPRPYIIKQGFTFVMVLILIFKQQFALSPNMRFGVPTMVELHHQVLDLHAIVSGFAGMGPEDKLGAFLCVLNSAELMRSDYVDVARREGLASSKALVTSLLRHCEFMGQPSAVVTDDLWSDFATALISCTSMRLYESGSPPVFGLDLDFSDLPGERVASIARALGICMGRRRHVKEEFDETFLTLVFELALDAQLLPHACAFLEAPGCLRRIVQVMCKDGSFPKRNLHRILLLISAAGKSHPARMAPLLRSSDFDRLVDLIFRPEAIERLGAIGYRSLIQNFLIRSGKGPEAATEQQLGKVFAEAREPFGALPALGQLEGGRSACPLGLTADKAPLVCPGCLCSWPGRGMPRVSSSRWSWTMKSWQSSMVPNSCSWLTDR